MQEELLAEGSERAGDVSIREEEAAGKISFKEKEVDGGFTHLAFKVEPMDVLTSFTLYHKLSFYKIKKVVQIMHKICPTSRSDWI